MRCAVSATTATCSSSRPTPARCGRWSARRPATGASELTGSRLRLPAGVELDLGATAKAAAADCAAGLVHDTFGTGVLVSLGGDIATAGPAPTTGWQVHVQDRDEDPWTQVELPAGSAIATSSTVSRRWVRGGRTMHHIVDPRTGQPARPFWRSVTVAAGTCVHANAVTTASLVRGEQAVDWVRGLGLPRPVPAPRRRARAHRRLADGTGGMNLTEALWYLGRGTGLVALLMFTLTMVLGITHPLGPRARSASTGSGSPTCTRPRAWPASAWSPSTSPPCSSTPTRSCGWSTWSLPFLGSYRPLWQGLGTAAIDVLLVIVATQPAAAPDRATRVPSRALGGVRDVAAGLGARSRQRHRRGDQVVPLARRRVPLAVARGARLAASRSAYAERGNRRVPRRLPTRRR